MSFSEWREAKLEDITVNHNPFRIPLSSKERSVKKGKYPYYGAQGIIDYIDEYIFEGEYLLVAEDGANLETRNQDIARLTSKDEKFWVNNHAHILRSNSNSDIRYIKYHLNRTDLSGYITGSAQPKLNKANLNSIKIKLPPLQEQKAIAHILSALDEKIETNNKTSKILEEMAQAIFKHWFVDFEFPNEEGEPYKSSGGEMVDSEFGIIPKGWEVTNIKDYSENMANGGTPRRNNSNYWNKRELPWLKTTEVKDDIIIEAEEWISTEGFENSSAKLFPKDTVLVAMYGVTAGKLGLLKFESTTNQACCGITCSDNKSPYYLYIHLKRNQNELKALARGSAQQNLSKAVIEEFNLILPNEEYLLKFHTVSKSIFEQIEINMRVNSKLRIIRDTLLPKLMSGEIRVPIDNEE